MLKGFSVDHDSVETPHILEIGFKSGTDDSSCQMNAYEIVQKGFWGDV